MLAASIAMSFIALCAGFALRESIIFERAGKKYDATFGMTFLLSSLGLAFLGGMLFYKWLSS